MKARKKKSKKNLEIKNAIKEKEIIEKEKLYELNSYMKQIETLEKENMELKEMLDSANLKYRVSINNEKKLRKIVSNSEHEKNNILQQYKDDLYEIERNIYQFTDDYKNELNETEEMKKSYEVIQKKYNALRNSKLGKLTLKYWEFRKGGK